MLLLHGFYGLASLASKLALTDGIGDRCVADDYQVEEDQQGGRCYNRPAVHELRLWIWYIVGEQYEIVGAQGRKNLVDELHNIL